MTGIILSGGKSSRMGENKAFLRVGGERLIDRTVRIFRSIFDEVIVVTNEPLDYLDQDVTLATDIVSGKGPLGGIYTGLFFSSFPFSFVAACDMPFLNEAFIRFMIDRAGENDIVVPETPDGLQPLHAVYSRTCLRSIAGLLEEDRVKVSELYRRMKTLKIQAEAILPYDPEFIIFSNVNSPDDLKKYSSK